MLQPPPPPRRAPLWRASAARSWADDVGDKTGSMKTPQKGRRKRDPCSEWPVGTPAAGATRCHCPVGSEPLLPSTSTNHQHHHPAPPPSTTQASACRPAQQGAAAVQARGRLKPELVKVNIFLIFFFLRCQGGGRFAPPLAPSCNASFPGPDDQLPTSHVGPYRATVSASPRWLGFPVHSERQAPGVPDATMQGTVHTLHLGNSKLDSTTVHLLLRSTHPFCHSPPLDARSLQAIIKRAACHMQSLRGMTQSHIPK